MRKIQEEFNQKLEIEWRSFLLRPEPVPNRDFEKFKAYTKSWKRPGENAPEIMFKSWASNEGPPSHSVPPHLVTKAAMRIDTDTFEAIHDRLFAAYFSENRDITSDQTLLDLWNELDLPSEFFKKREDPELLNEVYQQHHEAKAIGVTGVPAYILTEGFSPFVGAQSLEVYRKWVERMLEGDDVQFPMFRR